MKKLLWVVAVIVVLALGRALWQKGELAPVTATSSGTVVNVLAPQVVSLPSQIEAVGSLQARQSIVLSTEVAGRITAIHFVEGREVAANSLLVTLDDRLARAELARTEAALADAESSWQRARRLSTQNSISQAEAERLEALVLASRAERDSAATRLSLHRIQAPFRGVVGLTDLNVGSYVSAGEVITTLDDSREMEVLFSVPERQLSRIHVGQPVEVRSSAFGGQVFTGKVQQLDSRVDPATRSIRVKATLNNAQRQLRAGQFVQVLLNTGDRQALMVPEQAVLSQGARHYGFVVQNAHAQRRDLVLGERVRGWVEVLQGVDEQELLVINGHARLGDGNPVEVIEDPDALQASLLEPVRG